MSHLGLLVLFAACVSVVFATLQRDDLPAQRRLAGRLFGGLVLGAIAVGWLLFAMFR